VGGEQLVAAVAAGPAASPPSPGPEMSPMDVDEVAAGVLRGWAASPPSPAPEWWPMDLDEEVAAILLPGRAPTAMRSLILMTMLIQRT